MKTGTRKTNLKRAIAFICLGMIAMFAQARINASCNEGAIIVHTPNPDANSSSPVPRRAPARNPSETVYVEFLAAFNHVTIIIRNSDLSSETFDEGNVTSGTVIPVSIANSGEDTVIEVYSDGKLVDTTPLF